MIRKRWVLGVALLVSAVAAVWLFQPAPRAARPATPAPLSNIVELIEWRLDDLATSRGREIQFTTGTSLKGSGTIRTNPKNWCNVARTRKLPGVNGPTQPFMHVKYRFARAEGENVVIAASGPLNHSRSDQHLIKFSGPVRPPRVPGQYELQLAIGVEPPQSRLHGGLPYEWHVISRCDAEVKLPLDE